MMAGWQHLGIVVVCCALTAGAQTSEASWNFAVSGDSRNCGDVVMPGIAAGAIHDQASFYWHLGDLRAIFMIDEDMARIADERKTPYNVLTYENAAWDDFIQNQVGPFQQLPFHLGIGNHETIPPKNRDQFIEQFADWLDTPLLRDQRLADNRADHRLRTYYHWIQGGVDFLNMDNASSDQFDGTQLAWFNSVMDHDAKDPAVLTVVVGMHKALPFSISCDHSMSESGDGERSGVKVYQRLLAMQNESHKHVYLLASHSHFYMNGIFNTRYWIEHGGVLPGWIVGTAGAQRYRLPANKTDAKEAAENVYGYLLGTVHPDGNIDFQFKEVKEEDIPKEVREKYSKDWVKQTCIDGNRSMNTPQEIDYCAPVAQPVGQAAH